MNAKDILVPEATPLEDTAASTPLDTGLRDLPKDNVDQDGHCITPAYSEAVSPNSGAPCDDGRDGM